MAVAEASLSTCTDSMSAGLMPASGLNRALPEMVEVATSPLFTSTSVPSMTYNGCVPALMELLPRMTMLTSPPSSPDEEVTFTPATLPVSALSNEGVPDFFRSPMSTVPTAPVRSFLSMEP